MLPLESRAPLVELYQQHSAVHVYGLADLDEEYWNRSSWWMQGDVDKRDQPVPASQATEYQDLLNSDPEAGDFFQAGLLDSNHYVAIWDNAQESITQKIVAGAGVHVWNDEFSVCAMGNVAARGVYEQLGYREVIEYEEAELVRVSR